MNWSETCIGNIPTKIYVVYGHYIYYSRVLYGTENVYETTTN